MKLKIIVAVLGLMSAGAFAADATSISDADAGAVAGAIVETPIIMDSHADTKVLDLVAMPVAPLPPTIVGASYREDSVGECGERRVIKPSERSTHYMALFGAIPLTDKWNTAHGELVGYAKDQNPPLPAYLVRTSEYPAPFSGTKTVLIGHRLHRVTEIIGAGGGGSGTGNYASDGRYSGLGASGNSNSSFTLINYFVEDCVIAELSPKATPVASKPEPKAPTKECVAKRDGVKVKKGEVLTYPAGDKMPAECGG